MLSDTLAIDFGTSNSAAASLSENGVVRIPIENGQETLPTAVFFPPGTGEMQIGNAATRSLIDGEEGRYMRGLKSVLGLEFIHDKQLIGGRYRTIADIITAFLIVLRERSEAVTGRKFRKVLSGRPVHFHTADEERDRRAQDDLRACYLAAGFTKVSFLAEPEAAAMADHGSTGGTQTGLVVDIGGGTSDFSVFRSGGTKPKILASHGIRLGGTDFDHAVSMDHAMPLLGLGGELHRPMGPGLLPVPQKPYSDLATWSQIHFLYNDSMRRLVAKMVRDAVEPSKIGRLGKVIELTLGHELAFAVERAKIDVNERQAAGAVAMDFIEPGLAAPVSPGSLAASLSASREALREALTKTLERANVPSKGIERIVLVGGSSLMRFVADEAAVLCPSATIHRSDAFTAVVDGLALAATDACE